MTDMVGCEDASEYALQDQEATHAEEFSEANEKNDLVMMLVHVSRAQHESSVSEEQVSCWRILAVWCALTGRAQPPALRCSWQVTRTPLSQAE